MKRIAPLLLTSLLLASGCALAQTSTSPSTPASTPVSPASTPVAEMTEAEVRKVDQSAGKITLKHGEIKNLDMPPMSMVFQVKDPALLANIKPGDKVKFTAEKINGAYTVLTLESVK
jgi:Cu/Ag efflux protein CusF